MSHSDIAIRVRGLSKSYTIRHQQQAAESTLTETMLKRFRRPFGNSSTSETFWALKDVDFDVKKGDVVGVIGRNGAGKSTLLKILSRITEPTSGRIELYGRIGSLLEVGTGFHPELTGRENIFLNGNILGMSRAEIRKQFDAIVDFAGVEQFLDTPVKRYSSGMYVRLAFAVAAHLQSEILIVDEVLAVGDAEFQRKCLGKMKDVASGGRTVLFVSHHMQSVQVLCNRGMYLDRGKCSFAGDARGAIDRYVRSFEDPTLLASDPARRPGSGEIRAIAVSPTKEFFTSAEPKTVQFTLRSERIYDANVFVTFHVLDPNGQIVLHCDSRMIEYHTRVDGTYHGLFTIRSPWLKPGQYRLDFFVCNAGILDRFEDACRLNVIPLLPYPATGNEEATQYGSVFADFDYRAALPAGG